MQSSVANAHPAQLWVGNVSFLTQEAHIFLKNKWCKNNICNICTACKQIDLHQHASFLWIDGVNGYTLEALDSIRNHINLQRGPNDPFFFVLSYVDFLTSACANALLKSLEEPPEGYYFLLLAERKQLVLPTILSRCLVSHKNSIAQLSTHQELYSCFTQKIDPLTFLKILEKSKINERESIDLLDHLLEHFIIAYKKALSAQDTDKLSSSGHILQLLNHASSFYPMPGSSKIFWKNFFLQIYPPY